jgi:hypothetical protein
MFKYAIMAVGEANRLTSPGLEGGRAPAEGVSKMAQRTP